MSRWLHVCTLHCSACDGLIPLWPQAAAESAEASEEGGAADYDYLLSMPLWSLTMERVDALKQQRTEKEAELNALLAKSPTDLWIEDLDALGAALDDVDVRACVCTSVCAWVGVRVCVISGYELHG